MSDGSKFTPFPVPIHPDDKPLVVASGADYVCSGCNARVPDGLWIYETVEDDMVIGLRMQRGQEGEEIHRCGTVNA